MMSAVCRKCIKVHGLAENDKDFALFACEKCGKYADCQDGPHKIVNFTAFFDHALEKKREKTLWNVGEMQKPRGNYAKMHQNHAHAAKMLTKDSAKVVIGSQVMRSAEYSQIS